MACNSLFVLHSHIGSEHTKNISPLASYTKSRGTDLYEEYHTPLVKLISLRELAHIR